MSMTMHPAYIYAENVVKHKVIAPNYVIKQCDAFKQICDGKGDGCFVDMARVEKISKILKLIKMPKGLRINHRIYDCIAGFQWVLIIASLCVVEKDNPEKYIYHDINPKLQSPLFGFFSDVYLYPEFSFGCFTPFYFIIPEFVFEIVFQIQFLALGKTGEHP